MLDGSEGEDARSSCSISCFSFSTKAFVADDFAARKMIASNQGSATFLKKKVKFK